mmetsp:Transcript_5028/g.11337  ORF Transcript_5028/g.11337 Transcript_5028/m.11337 type:complete len:351 (+) Transcript_5028:661-1713(+)
MVLMKAIEVIPIFRVAAPIVARCFHQGTFSRFVEGGDQLPILAAFHHLLSVFTKPVSRNPRKLGLLPIGPPKPRGYPGGHAPDVDVFAGWSVLMIRIGLEPAAVPAGKDLQDDVPIASGRFHPPLVHATTGFVVNKDDRPVVDEGPCRVPDKPFFEMAQVAAYFLDGRIAEHLVFVIHGPLDARPCFEGFVQEEGYPRQFLARTGTPPRGNRYVRVGVFHCLYVFFDDTGIVGAVLSEVGDESGRLRVHAPGFGIPGVIENPSQRKLKGSPRRPAIVDAPRDPLHPYYCFSDYHRQSPPIVDDQASSWVVGGVGRPNQCAVVVSQHEVSVLLHYPSRTTSDAGAPNDILV